MEPIEDHISDLIEFPDVEIDEVAVADAVYVVSEMTSHRERPERISEFIPSVIPTTTVLGIRVHHTVTGIAVIHFIVCIAVLGTISTSSLFSMVIFTVTDIPSYIFLSHFVIAILA
jgi:hypothetical protein